MKHNNKINEYLERTLKFHDLYNSELGKIWRQQEEVRKHELKWFYILILLAISVIILLPIMICKIFSLPFDAITVIAIWCILLALFIIWAASNKINNFALKLKEACLPIILPVFGDIKWRKGKVVISEPELDESGLFARFNHRTTDDEFVGNYHGVNFKVCETHLWYESGSSKSKTYYDVFKGVIIAFEANKTIKNRTIVTNKWDINKKNGAICVLLPFILQIIPYLFTNEIKPIMIAVMLFFALLLLLCFRNWDKEPLDKVTLEDPKFNARYNVYSSSQIEARYLITPSFMERFKNLKTAFDAKKIKCSFYNDKIMFAITANKNLFEIGSLFTSLKSKNSLNNFYDELSSIYKMIEYFKIDEKIGL